MAELPSLLYFSIIPMALVALFSILTPSIGAILAIRNEMMLALALPSVANAGVTMGLLCGIDPEHELSLYGFASITVMLSIFGVSRIRNNASNKEIYLAALFVGGQILSSTFSALSPVAYSHVSHLLNGEILATGSLETGLLALLCFAFTALTVLNRHSILAWCADSEFFRVGAKRYHFFLIAIYTVFAVIITLGVATIGSLPMTVLLVLPALFGNSGTGGIHKYLATSTSIGVIGGVGGFLVALGIDFPPAISAALGVCVMGFLFRLLCWRR